MVTLSSVKPKNKQFWLKTTIKIKQDRRVWPFDDKKKYLLVREDFTYFTNFLNNLGQIYHANQPIHMAEILVNLAVNLVHLRPIKQLLEIEFLQKVLKKTKINQYKQYTI